MLCYSDCYDFNVSISGAADTRDEEAAPIVYSFFDEIPFILTRHYTCDSISDNIIWRHVRLGQVNLSICSNP